MNMYLRELTKDDEKEVMEFCQEFINHPDYDSFEGISNFKNLTDYNKFLDDLALSKHIEDVNPAYVSGTTYVLCDENNHIYGALNIRHYLVDSLMKRGGNIGYAIRYSERGKGYGPLILKLGLQKARDLNVNAGSKYEDKVLVTCRKSNIPFAKTIMKCCGELASEEYNENVNDIEQCYWIDIAKVLGAKNSNSIK